VLDYILRLNEEGKIVKTKRIVVTATTGLAACNVGGVTIHSFAGVGTGEDPIEKIVTRVLANQYAKQRWKDCDILIIDEISMMPAAFLDTLSVIASRVRNDRRNFGGIQLVVCGDFFQLPPINLKKNKFAFEAKCWPTVINTSICLSQNFRQNGDSVLMTVLNEARVADLSQNSLHLLHEHSKKKSFKDEECKDIDGKDMKRSKPTMIECRNQTVDLLNNKELNKLKGKIHRFQSRDRAVNRAYEKQLKHCQAPEKLELKVGATVMLLKNLDPKNGLVNGSRGIIEDFRCHPKASDLPREYRKVELPVVQFDPLPGRNTLDSRSRIIEPSEWKNKIGDTTISARVQIPLRLGYALTVHKSQGMTIPKLVVNLSETFEYGQGYVALSRATSFKTLILNGFSDEHCFRAHPKVKQFYRMIESSNNNKPLVEIHPIAETSGLTITAKQRQRMELNRKNAIAIRQERNNAEER